MRVKISTNPPLPPVRAWFPLNLPSEYGHTATPTIFFFKSTLCTSLPSFRGVPPTSLRLSIDGFQLLDDSELTVVRDGDLICVDRLDVPSEDAATQQRASHRGVSHVTQKNLRLVASRKRKRRESPSGSSSSDADSETESSTSLSTSGSESESSDSESESDLDSDSDSNDSHPTTPSLRKAELPKAHARERVQTIPSIQPKPHVAHPSTFVPPGYGKPQTRSRNLRRRLKRVREREASSVSEDGPVSGANAVAPGKDARVSGITPTAGDAAPPLLSLSLRNKNKAKNFKSLIDRPLPPKIIFGDQEGDASAPTPSEIARDLSKSQTTSMPRLIPPSSRSSLPPNIFVTSIDVEAGLGRGKKKHKMRVEYGHELERQIEDAPMETGENEDILLDYGDGVDTDKRTVGEENIDKLESIANMRWATLEKPTSEKQLVPGAIVGYKALGINPVTYTPERCLTIGRVVSCDSETVVVRLLRGREEVSFSGPVEAEDGVEAAEGHTWADVIDGDWRLLAC